MENYLKLAIKEALMSIEQAEGAPFGACIVRDRKIISSAHDTVLKDCDPTKHAEMNAISKACQVLNKYSLGDCEIFCTSEPCPMCLAAIYWAGIKKCTYIASKEFSAEFGFDDKLIYEEIASSLDKRNIALKQDNIFLKSVEDLFAKSTP